MSNRLLVRAPAAFSHDTQGEGVAQEPRRRRSRRHSSAGHGAVIRERSSPVDRGRRATYHGSERTRRFSRLTSRSTFPGIAWPLHVHFSLRRIPRHPTASGMTW